MENRDKVIPASRGCEHLMTLICVNGLAQSLTRSKFSIDVHSIMTDGQSNREIGSVVLIVIGEFIWELFIEHLICGGS